MVAIKQIRACNGQLNDETVPRTAVFVGATSGIGKATLQSLVNIGSPVRAYIVGRASTESAMKPFLDELRASNPKADLIYVPGEVSLLAEVKRISLDIKSREPTVDLLFLSAGYAPLGGRIDTSEGFEVTMALQYFGRILMTLHLLPNLRAAASPRVVSVLSGNLLHPSLNVDDMTLDKPGAWGGIRSQTQVGSLTNLALDRLAADPANASLSFTHDWPGAVDTGNAYRHWKGPSLWAPLPLTALLKPIYWIMGYSFDETGQRHLYLATSGDFGGRGPKIEGVHAESTSGRRGGGLYLLDHRCDAKFKKPAFEKLKDSAQERVWTRTMEILEPFL
ncbi:hypothetical protein VDGD_02653 [Verticillium dahliae]|nr:NmrA-like family domain-containing oxidoreductase notO [Verticillium longisporum]RBQ70846.1 hypothetical protein VDGD_02653 [Verticillium dahliae]